MYIEYKGQLYELIEDSPLFGGKPVISTYFEEKTDNTFSEFSDYYAKELKPDDADVRNIYDVDFYVVYHDTSRTTDMNVKKQCTWCVNEDHAGHYASIENDEVSIVLDGESYSEDWVRADRGLCSKTVSIYDCEKLRARYTYSVRDGKKLDKDEVVEVTMRPEAFKAEMLKYRDENI